MRFQRWQLWGHQLPLSLATQQPVFLQFCNVFSIGYFKIKILYNRKTSFSKEMLEQKIRTILIYKACNELGYSPNMFYQSQLCCETLILQSRAGKWNPFSIVTEILHRKLTNNCLSLGQLLPVYLRTVLFGNLQYHGLKVHNNLQQKGYAELF